MNLNKETQTVTVNEYELHDIIASAREGLIRHEASCPDDIKTGMEVFARISIEPKQPHLFTAEHVHEWEQKINTLLELLGGLDAEYHDDAEYTC